MDLHLSDEEHVVVQEALSGAVRDLHSEIAATDNAEYRSALRRRSAALMSVLDRLGGVLPPS